MVTRGVELVEWPPGHPNGLTPARFLWTPGLILPAEPSRRAAQGAGRAAVSDFGDRVVDEPFLEEADEVAA